MSWAEINGRPRMISAYNETKVNLTLPDRNKIAINPDSINELYWVMTSKRLTTSDFKSLLLRISGKKRIEFKDEEDGSVTFSKDYRNLALRALKEVYPEIKHLTTPPPNVLKCDRRCREAQGLECKCKGCDGRFHRSDDLKNWKSVGETTIIKVGPVTQYEETILGTQEPDEHLSQEGWEAMTRLFEERGAKIFWGPSSPDFSALWIARVAQEKANQAKFHKAFLNSKPVGETQTHLSGE